MKLRLVALIALVVGLSRLALAAEKKPIVFESVKLPVLNTQTRIAAKPRTFVKKKPWSGTRRVTRRRSALRPKATVPPLATPAAAGRKLITAVPAVVVPSIVREHAELASVTLAKAAPPPAQPLRALAYRHFQGNSVPPSSEAEHRRVTLAHPRIPVRAHWSVATITAEYSPRLGASGGPTLAGVRDVSFGDPRFIGDQQYRVRVAFRL